MQEPGRDGHFFYKQTNKHVKDIYIVARGNSPPFSRRPPCKGHQSLSLDLASVGKTLPGKKLLKILLKIVEICTCDDEIIVNVTLTENIQLCL